MELTYLVDIKTGFVWDDDLGWNNSRASLKGCNEWAEVARHNDEPNSLFVPHKSGTTWQGRDFKCMPIVPFLEFDILT